MDELAKTREYQKIILRNQIAILDMMEALAKELTGKIPVISVEVSDITGGTSIIDVVPTIRMVKFCQEAPDYFALTEE